MPASTPLVPRAPRGILVIRVDPPDLGLVENIERSISRQRWASLRRSLVCPSYVDFARHFIPHLLLDDMDGDIIRAVLRANPIRLRWSSWWNSDSQILATYEMGLNQYPDLFETGSFSLPCLSPISILVLNMFLDLTSMSCASTGTSIVYLTPLLITRTLLSPIPPDVFFLPIVLVGMR